VPFTDEQLAGLGEGVLPEDYAGRATMDQATAVRMVMAMPVGHLLGWLLSAGAAGTLAGGWSWRRWRGKGARMLGIEAKLASSIDRLTASVEALAIDAEEHRALLAQEMERQTGILAGMSATLGQLEERTRPGKEAE
jgi:hypothetical protein